MTNSVAYVYLMSGQIFSAFFQPYLELIGAYVYAFMLGVMWLGMYIRSNSVGNPTIWLLWVIVLYGSLMPGAVSGGIMTLCFIGGAAAIVMHAYSPVK